jgi:hypothetical protein
MKRWFWMTMIWENLFIFHYLFCVIRILFIFIDNYCKGYEKFNAIITDELNINKSN